MGTRCSGKKKGRGYTSSLAALRSIDVSACPKDFREAWDAYVKEEEWKQSPQPELKALTAFALGGWKGAANALPAMKRDGDRRRSDATWQAVCRGADRYGVKGSPPGER